jgi:hypothetical protein
MLLGNVKGWVWRIGFVRGLYVRRFRNRGMDNGKESKECDVLGICREKGEGGSYLRGETDVVVVIFVGQ